MCYLEGIINRSRSESDRSNLTLLFFWGDFGACVLEARGKLRAYRLFTFSSTPSYYTTPINLYQYHSHRTTRMMRKASWDYTTDYSTLYFSHVQANAIVQARRIAERKIQTALLSATLCAIPYINVKDAKWQLTLHRLTTEYKVKINPMYSSKFVRDWTLENYDTSWQYVNLENWIVWQLLVLHVSHQRLLCQKYLSNAKGLEGNNVQVHGPKSVTVENDQLWGATEKKRRAASGSSSTTLSDNSGERCLLITTQRHTGAIPS